MSTSPPYALTSSTSLTNCFRRATEGELCGDIVHASVDCSYPEEIIELREVYAPKQFIRHEQLADGPSLCGLEDVALTVPCPQRVLLEHLEEPGWAQRARQPCRSRRGSPGRTHFSSMTPSCANLVSFSWDETCGTAHQRKYWVVAKRAHLGARQDLSKRVDVVGRRVQEQDLALGLHQRLVVLSLCVEPNIVNQPEPALSQLANAGRGVARRTTASSSRNEYTVSFVNPGDAMMSTLSCSKSKCRFTAS